MARIFPLFLILALILLAAPSWAQTLGQEDYKRHGIEPPPSGFVDIVGIPDTKKMPTDGAFPKGMTVVESGLFNLYGVPTVVLRVPAEREHEAWELMRGRVDIQRLDKCNIGWWGSKRPVNPACAHVYLTRMLAVPPDRAFPPEGVAAEIVDPGTRCYSPTYRLKVPAARVAEIERLLETMPGLVRFCASTKF